MSRKRWIPSAMEQRALDHLASPEGWRWMGYERPDEATPVGWRPFWKIYLFNLVVFAPVFIVLAFFGWRTLAEDDPNMRLDALAALALFGFVALPSALMALVMVGLYRRSWNRRARAIRDEAE